MSTSRRSPIGRYELREKLGAGGMGTVWHAWDPSLQRDVAVKEVLLPSGMDPADRAEAHARTLREAQATARISNTAVVTIHDVLEHGDSPWIVMELLSGTSLQYQLDHHGPMTVERVEQAAKSLLGGLKAAHAAGVTHRDVKPANIMLTDDDRTVLTDFGIANVDGGAALTQTGVYIGSPEYMAPERFEGERALPASDLWSLGVTLYSLLEGRSPFKRDSITGIISAVLTAPMPPRPPVGEGSPGSSGTPLRVLIEALLNRDASERPSPEEALDLLEREKRSLTGIGGPGTSGSGTGPNTGVANGNGGGPGGGPPQAPSGAHTAYGVAGRQQPPGPSGPYPAYRQATGGNTPHPNAPHPDTPHPDAPYSHASGPNAPGFNAPGFDPSGPNAPGGYRPAPNMPGPNTPHPMGQRSGGYSPAPNTPWPGGPGAPGTHNTPGPVSPQRTTTVQGPVPGAGPTGFNTPYGAAAGGQGPWTGNGQGAWATGGQGSWTGSGRPDMPKPASVITASVMLGTNAIYLMILTALFAGEAINGTEGVGWGSVSVLGAWGLFSAFAAVGLMMRSRLLYGVVLLVQIIMAVVLVFSMFSVLIYNPEQLMFYVMMLVFNLVIGGLLLLPPKARVFFGLGENLG